MYLCVGGGQKGNGRMREGESKSEESAKLSHWVEKRIDVQHSDIRMRKFLAYQFVCVCFFFLYSLTPFEFWRTWCRFYECSNIKLSVPCRYLLVHTHLVYEISVLFCAHSLRLPLIGILVRGNKNAIFLCSERQIGGNARDFCMQFSYSTHTHIHWNRTKSYGWKLSRKMNWCSAHISISKK